LFAQDANRPENTQLNCSDRCPQGISNFVVRLFFDKSERRRYLQLGRQAAKCLLDLLSRFPLEEMIGRRLCGGFCEQTLF